MKNLIKYVSEDVESILKTVSRLSKNVSSSVQIPITEKRGLLSAFSEIEEKIEDLLMHLEVDDSNSYANGGEIEIGQKVKAKASYGGESGIVENITNNFVVVKTKDGNKSFHISDLQVIENEEDEDDYAKGGKLKMYDKDNEYRIGRPTNYIEKEILARVNHDEKLFVGSFGWRTESNKLAEGYLYNLDSFDQNLVKDIKLKDGEKIFRYFNRNTAIGGITPFIKINLEKELLYYVENFIDEEVKFVTKGIKAEWIALIEDKMAKGGEVYDSFTYMMLGRLKSDNEYYLGYGNRSDKNLWAGNVDGQIAEMKKLWNQLPKDGKPEWLTMEDIEKYEIEMKGNKMADGGMMAKGGISKDSTWYQANYKLQNGLDSNMNFSAKSDREAIKLANNQLKRPNAELLNIYLVKGDKYTIVYGDSWESIRDTPEIGNKNTMAKGGEIGNEEILSKEDVKKLYDRYKYLENLDEQRGGNTGFKNQYKNVINEIEDKYVKKIIENSKYQDLKNIYDKDLKFTRFSTNKKLGLSLITFSKYWMNSGGWKIEKLSDEEKNKAIKELKKLFPGIIIEKPIFNTTEYSYGVEKYEYINMIINFDKYGDGGMMAKGGKVAKDEIEVGDSVYIVYYMDSDGEAYDTPIYADSEKEAITKFENDNPQKEVSYARKMNTRTEYDIFEEMREYKDGGETKQIIELTPIYTKRDKQGFRFYSIEDGNTLYAEKNGKIYNVSKDSLKVIGEVPRLRAKVEFVGLINDEDVKNLYPLHYEYKTLGKIKKSFGMAKGGDIDFGHDLGDGFSIGNDVHIIDPKSLFINKTGYVSGLAGKDLLVTLIHNGNERNVVVSKKGVEKIHTPMANGGEVKSLKEYLNKLINTLPNSPSKANKNKILKEISDTRVKIKNLELKDKMANGGEVNSIDSLYYLQVIKDDKEVAREKFRAKNLKQAKEISEKEYESSYISKYGSPLNFIVSEAMAMGGKVTFQDKVKAIQKKLLANKKVPKAVQKDYGKTYNKDEAKESAQRIVGSMAKNKMAKGRLVSDKPKFKKFIAEGNVDGYFIAQIASGLHTGNLDKNMKNLEDWNDEYDIFPDWDEDDDDSINEWAKKKFKSAETSPSDFSKNFRSVWFEGDNKEKVEKEIEKLKSEGFSYYGLLKDSMGYGGLDIVVVTKKPVKTKDFSMDKPIDEMLEDGHLKNLWDFNNKNIKKKEKMAKGGKTSISTLKDRIIGSKKNKPGSASSKTSAQKIELSETIIKSLSDKAKEYNEKHSNKVSTNALKAVMRRGMGAFSSSHRPGMTRQGWGYARVNKFLLKKGGTKVKAAYVQDDDLLENGGELKKIMKVSDKPKFKRLIDLEERAKDSMYKPSNVNNFTKWNESVGVRFRNKWNKMVLELRGYNDSEGNKKDIKPEWIKFVEEQGLVEDYDFGDVLA